MLIGLSEFANRMIFTTGSLPRIEPMGEWEIFGFLPAPLATIAEQYGLTYIAFFVVVPLAWWVLMKTPLGLAIRAVGENPEAADVAGINVFRVRYVALMIGGALMAVGGAFITLAVAIRTATVRHGEVHYWAGGGIVEASDPDREVAETELKAKVFLDAVEALRTSG